MMDLDYVDTSRIESILTHTGNITIACRQLSAEERKSLRQNNVSASDWESIYVHPDINVSMIGNTNFTGKNILNISRTDYCISDTDIEHCIISNPCKISRTNLLRNVIIEEDCIISGVGEIDCSKASLFSYGNTINVGVEIGGRSVMVYPEMDFNLAVALATHREDNIKIKTHANAVTNKEHNAKSEYSIICKGAIIKNTIKLDKVYIGEYALIDGASWISDSTILSTTKEPCEVNSSSIIKNSILQWGCTVSNAAVVQNSFMAEHSAADEQAKLDHTILGPNSKIGSGEAKHSLIGPFVNQLHQSLLISCIFPHGKGNVAYGANIGSNHTSKSPDQEIFCGEGIFFGLGVNVKYPANFTESPFSIFASGINLLPQKISFPFSLINSPSIYHPQLSPAYNEIFPGWVLSDNIYMIRRNEAKFKARNKSTKTAIEFEVFRQENIDLMIIARDHLVAAKGKHVLTDACIFTKNEHQPIYTDLQIPNLGKNYITESSRIKAIQTYTFHIQFFALEWMSRLLKSVIVERPDKCKHHLIEYEFYHQKEFIKGVQLFNNEFNASKEEDRFEVVTLLNVLLTMYDRVLQNTIESKQKDDIRGAKVIDDYKLTHVDVSLDTFVIETSKMIADEKRTILSLISHIKSF